MPERVLSECGKPVEKERDQKTRVLVGDASSHQFLIPGSFPLHLDFSGQSNWNSWMLGGNAMWNWGMLCHML